MHEDGSTELRSLREIRFPHSLGMLYSTFTAWLGFPVNEGEYVVSLNPDSGRGREEILEQLLDELRDEAPGVDIELEQPLMHLMSHMLSGVTAQIAIKIHGDDLPTLRRLATRVKSAIQEVPGVTPPVIEAVRETEELHVRLRPDDLAWYGVSRAHVASVVQTALT